MIEENKVDQPEANQKQDSPNVGEKKERRKH
jgi:hypothetical protein